MCPHIFEDLGEIFLKCCFFHAGISANQMFSVHQSLSIRFLKARVQPSGVFLTSPHPTRFMRNIFRWVSHRSERGIQELNDLYVSFYEINIYD
jgi:hypothetical protein